MTTYGWHFVNDTLRDGRPVPPDGEWLEHDGELVLCQSGLHASERLIDALYYAPYYAPGTICRVEVDGEILHDDDKLVAMRRRILWRVDGEAVLQAFARWAALEVAHLWDMPTAVREYLETGNEQLRAAARAAAWAAAWDEAGDAVGDAAWAAASSAAGDAAWDVGDAAQAAAWAARAVAQAAVRAAAWAAVRDAARDAAGDAWAAAWDAAMAAQNEQLERIVSEARDGRTEWVFESAEQPA